MMEVLEMTASRSYDTRTGRRIRLLKRIRTVLILGLAAAWIYGIAIAAALVTELNGAATGWLVYFGMFTIPAVTLLILVCWAVRKLTKEFDYLLTGEELEIYSSTNGTRRKLVARVRRGDMVAFGRETDLPPARGQVIVAGCGRENLWALDVTEDGHNTRILLAPNEDFQHRLKAYVR